MADPSYFAGMDELLGKSNSSNSGGSTAGLGGYTPSQTVQDTYNAITSGSYLNNPYDEATQNKEWADWNNTRNQYGNDYGFKYIADQGLSDDDITWIKRQIDSNPQFKAEDAQGNQQRISDLFDQFYYGKQTGEDEAGKPIYAGGYKDTLDKANRTPAQAEFDALTDDEKIRQHAEQVYRDKTRYYNEMFRKESQNPQSPYYGADYSTFMNYALKMDNEMAQAKKEMEDAQKAIDENEAMNPSQESVIEKAFKAALKPSETEEKKRIQELELGMGMAYTPEDQAYYAEKLYDLTGDKKYLQYFKPKG